MNIRIEFHLNGESRLRETDASASLLDILRLDLGQGYLREGCRRGHCGACTVLMDGYPVASCLVPAFNLEGTHVETLTGFMETEGFTHIETGFLKAGFHPCKYCAPAKILIAETILRRNDGPPGEQTVLQYTRDAWCNCTSRAAFVRAVQAADSIRRKRRAADAHRR
jgi:aerobic-type carbon monoxide dehydrogenase small subunit (CoxS/CutS family)